MASVTDHYGISRPVPFINIDVDADNRLYLDPHAVRLMERPQPFADDAVRCVDTFLDTVTGCIFDGSRAARFRGEQYLRRFVEPWETRLGMAEEGFRGHGGAGEVGMWIWETLTGDAAPLVRIGMLHQLEDLPLFVDGVDRDITSDITTRIIYGPMARFTEWVVANYPEFVSGGHQVQTFRKQVWNPVTCEWDEAEVTLPVANGKELLLVPIGWAGPTLLMSAGRYYGTTLLSYAQMEQAVRTSEGKVLKSRKLDLRKQPGLEPGRQTILAVTLRAIGNKEDLLVLFKAFVDGRFNATNDADEAAA
ncbi:hypothetical protein GCM10022240_31550 [Microbacterium kribbense]|uniref:DUF3445 domain-containing protein n=1 Tax=Microbacterium kribbense TaxID=433645 RepID=A0ABP7H016_9MICO